VFKYKLLCKKKTALHDVGNIAEVTGKKEYWITFCNVNSDTWEFLGEVDSVESNAVESFPVKPPAAKPIVVKPIKYLNRVNNNNL